MLCSLFRVRERKAVWYQATVDLYTLPGAQRHVGMQLAKQQARRRLLHLTFWLSHSVNPSTFTLSQTQLLNIVGILGPLVLAGDLRRASP